LKIGGKLIEPGIYLNFCAKNPKGLTICGKKIEPGEWEYKFSYHRAAIFYHPYRKIYRSLMALGPILVVADMTKIDIGKQLYMDTAYENYRKLQQIKYYPYFEAVYEAPKTGFNNIVYDGYEIHINKLYDLVAPDLGELLTANDKELTFTHGKVEMRGNRIHIEWYHEPPKQAPQIGKLKAYLWY